MHYELEPDTEYQRDSNTGTNNHGKNSVEYGDFHSGNKHEIDRIGQIEPRMGFRTISCSS